MKSETPRTQYAADHEHSGLELAEKLERELNKWRDMAERLADFMSGGHVSACKCQKCDVYRELKQMRAAAMPNVQELSHSHRSLTHIWNDDNQMSWLSRN
jgi:hypothetical protein